MSAAPPEVVRSVPTGHADRPVEVVTLDGRLAVRKTYRAGGVAEVHAQMAALWASTLAGRMPEPFGCDVGTGSMTMQFVDGPALGTRGDLGGTVHHLDEVVEVLVDLHAAPVVVPRRRDAGRLVRSLGRKADELADRAVGGAYRRAVGSVAAVAPPGEALVVSHGDFSPRNLLVAPTGLVLIDFDRLQMAGRARDLAYLGAWCWVTTLMADGRGDWSVAGEALERYRACTGAAGELDRAWPFHLGASLLRIAHGWSALATRDDLAGRVIAEAVRVSHTRGVG